jgi:acyl-CoA dehydrogenase
MALVLNEEQVMLRDAARDFLTARAPVEHLRSLRDAGNSVGYSSELWAEIVDMGWAAIVVAEEHGGLGYGFAGIGLLLEESGRTLTPTPLLSCLPWRAVSIFWLSQSMRVRNTIQRAVILSRQNWVVNIP